MTDYYIWPITHAICKSLRDRPEEWIYDGYCMTHTRASLCIILGYSQSMPHDLYAYVYDGKAQRALIQQYISHAGAMENKDLIWKCCGGWIERVRDRVLEQETCLWLLGMMPVEKKPDSKLIDGLLAREFTES